MSGHSKSVPCRAPRGGCRQTAREPPCVQDCRIKGYQLVTYAMRRIAQSNSNEINTLVNRPSQRLCAEPQGFGRLSMCGNLNLQAQRTSESGGGK